MNPLLLIIFPLLWLLYRMIRWRIRISEMCRTMPVAPALAPPYSLLRRLIPKSWQTYHADWQFQDRRRYDNLGTNIVPLVCLFGKDTVYVADADAVVEIATNINRFPKDLQLYKVLDIYGRNVVTSDGAAWRLHRKVTSRPFSERNNQLVHEESVRQVLQMMESWDLKSHNGAVTIEKPKAETMKFTLHVITGAGFGVPFSWEVSSDEVWPNHQLSFRDAVSSVLHHLLGIVLIPKPLWKLPVEYLREVEKGYKEFGKYMHELLDREKKRGKDSDGQNLLAALVKHAAEDDVCEKGRLTDQEIIGNTFIFLIAGHETTSNTLLYAFTMLAINPSIQETLRQEIRSTIGDRLPTYDDFNNLVYPLCVVLETLRMFPPVIAIPKHTANSEQTLLGKYLIPKDVTIHFDTVHLHHNSKYWGDDVDTFNPSRFDGRNLKEKIVQKDTGDTAPGATNEKIKMPVKGAFIPFSEGSRSCLGRKFAQVESVACLVMVMQRWKIELKEGWSVERVWEVMDKSITIITMFPPVDIPLVFKKL